MQSKNNDQIPSQQQQCFLFCPRSFQLSLRSVLFLNWKNCQIYYRFVFRHPVLIPDNTKYVMPIDEHNARKKEAIRIIVAVIATNFLSLQLILYQSFAIPSFLNELYVYNVHKDLLINKCWGYNRL